MSFQKLRNQEKEDSKLKKEVSFVDKLDQERGSSREEFLQKSIRETHSDLWFKSTSVNNANFSNTLFTRLVSSKETKFVNVDFSYCIFDHAYIRACSFENCNFTGAKFLNTNFQGTSFTSCDFRYAIFEKTLIDDDFIFSNLPKESNLRQKLLRSLRVNFQQLGDSTNVNKSIVYELDATAEYLWDAAFSNEKYYLKKYGGFKKRLEAIIKLINFEFWDFIWGNGEKIWKIVRFLIIMLIIIVVYDVYRQQYPQGDSISYAITALKNSFSVFFGINTPSHFTSNFIAFIMFTRLFIFALFVSIMVKRLNRR